MSAFVQAGAGVAKLMPIADDLIYQKRTSCRACEGNRLHLFLSLGPTPLANSFLRSVEDFTGEPSFPLDVYFCETCSLVQVLDVIHPEVLFRNYIYVTGTSDTMAVHNSGYARAVTDLLKLGQQDLVVEVASNDGSLLKRFQQYGVRTLGVEPARNIAQMACADGVQTIDRFFNASTAKDIWHSHGPARAVIANNVLAHVDEPKDFLCGCRELLADDGMVIVEVPYLGELLDRLEYDTIYHEHLCYFSVTALLRLCSEARLSVIQIDRVPVHGGSLRMFAGREEHYGNHASEVLAWVDRERNTGLLGLGRYQLFAEAVRENRRSLLELLWKLNRAEKSIAGYGAPAKGNTLLNYCKIDTRLIPFTVDRNGMKIGLYTPGVHLPVRPVSALLECQPDYLMILAWNFADEIIHQQHEYRARGGQFILPVPEPRIV